MSKALLIEPSAPDEEVDEIALQRHNPAVVANSMSVVVTPAPVVVMQPAEEYNLYFKQGN